MKPARKRRARFVGRSLFATLASLSAATLSCALPVLTNSADLEGRVSLTGVGSLSVTIPFVDPTSACPSMFGHESRFPFETPAALRDRCGRESAPGNLAASVIYGQMLLFGYGGNIPQTEHGIATLSAAAAEGSISARRARGFIYRNGAGVPRDFASAPGSNRRRANTMVCLPICSAS